MNKAKEEIEQIAEQVVDAMLKVHRALGPGLLESAYQTCLAHELRCRGIEVGCEVALPVRYEGIEIEVGYRIDTLVAECIVIEVLERRGWERGDLAGTCRVPLCGDERVSGICGDDVAARSLFDPDRPNSCAKKIKS
jgi:hypothetical protein